MYYNTLRIGFISNKPYADNEGTGLSVLINIGNENLFHPIFGNSAHNFNPLPGKRVIC